MIERYRTSGGGDRLGASEGGARRMEGGGGGRGFAREGNSMIPLSAKHAVSNMSGRVCVPLVSSCHMEGRRTSCRFIW